MTLNITKIYKKQDKLEVLVFFSITRRAFVMMKLMMKCAKLRFHFHVFWLVYVKFWANKNDFNQKSHLFYCHRNRKFSKERPVRLHPFPLPCNSAANQLWRYLCESPAANQRRPGHRHSGGEDGGGKEREERTAGKSEKSACVLCFNGRRRLVLNRVRGSHCWPQQQQLPARLTPRLAVSRLC